MNSPNRQYQFALFSSAHHSIYSTTHDRMYDFLPMNEECRINTTMYGANMQLWYSTRYGTFIQLLIIFINAILAK